MTVSTGYTGYTGHPFEVKGKFRNPFRKVYPVNGIHGSPQVFWAVSRLRGTRQQTGYAERPGFLRLYPVCPVCPVNLTILRSGEDGKHKSFG